jgi:hypothetical protein
VHELAEFEIFGQTSAGFAKQPHRIEIQDSLGNDLDKSLLGMPADSDWRLRNPYNDKTLLNDFLGFELWEKMGHYSVRRRFVEVFRDTGGGRLTYPGDYYGVMVLTETIKVNKDRVDIPSLSPYSTNLAVTDGGFIFKRDKDSPGDLNFNSPGSPGGSGNVAGAGIPLKLHEPKVQSMRKVPLTSGATVYPGAGYTTSATNQMNYLINFLRTMERAMYTNTWLTQTGTNHYSYYLDPVAFADQMLHVEYTKQIDGYRLSDYFTKGRDGRIAPGPVWDWNLAYGNADYLAGGQTNGWYYEAAGEQDHPWARRLITGSGSSTASAGDPNFVQLVADRWAMFRTNILNATNTIREIDQLSDFLSEAAARDLYGKYRSGLIGVYTWPNPGGTADGRDVDYVHPTNYLGPIETVAPAGVTNSIIGQMKKWMLGRYLWIDSQFTKVPTFNTPGGLVPSGATATVTPPLGATLYYTLDGTDPRASGGTVIPGAFSNSGPVVITVTSNIHIVARAKAAGAWKGTFSAPNDISLYTTIPPLRITEIMYHPVNPPPGLLTNADHFEYLEVKNISGSPLEVGGFSLHGGVNFEFPDQILTNGESAVIVRDVAAFQSRYGTSPRILGSYANDNLANDGDHLVLQGNLGEPILNFSYNDNWYPATDGQGFSLQVVNDGAPTDSWGLKTSWRASGVLAGTPSAPDPGPAGVATIYVNEALTHTDPLPGDAIELYNPASSVVNLGGWFLTDDFGQPRKYRIPDNTMIPANGYLVFYQSNSFGSTNMLVTTNAFALSSHGDEVYVFSADLGGNLTGWAHGYRFGPQADGVTFGRYLTSLDEDRFVAQSAATLGATNSGPQVGPIVISEIYYHPPDIRRPYVTIDNDRDEYIELQNTSDNDVPLYDILNPGNTWRLRDAVDFTFPPGAFVPARGFVLVVGIDPAAFRAAGGVPMDTPVYGPWAGKLDNSKESVELVRPDHPEPPGTSSAGLVSYLLVDKVGYQDTFPWPAGLPDGLGGSLSRINSAAFGDDPVNWNAGPRTPGAPFISGGIPPAIVTQPVDTSGIEGQSATFTINATGSALGYIWTFNGELIPSAPSLPTLTLSPLILEPNPDGGGPGTYACIVFNSAGSVQSGNATLMVRQLPRVTLQPTNRAVWIKPDVRAVNTPNGTNVTFTVAATSVEPPIRYQWRFNGTNIPGATNASLLVTNVQVTDEGDYYCVVSDGVGSVSGGSAHLTPLIQPMIVQSPLGQTVVEGSDFGQSVEIIGHPPPFAYSWRRALPAGTIASNYVNARSNFITVNSTTAGLILPSGVISSNYEIRLVIQNEANLTPGVLIRFTNTVVADFDRDGIPDAVETALGLNANDATDGTGDLDGDGMSNQAEYAAGTDPANGASYLKITSITAGAGATLTFGAVSYKTYSIQYSGNLGSRVWTRLVDVLARSSNRVETITDPAWTSNRAYRVVTPRQP